MSYHLDLIYQFLKSVDKLVGTPGPVILYCGKLTSRIGLVNKKGEIYVLVCKKRQKVIFEDVIKAFKIVKSLPWDGGATPEFEGMRWGGEAGKTEVQVLCSPIPKSREGESPKKGKDKIITLKHATIYRLEWKINESEEEAEEDSEY